MGKATAMVTCKLCGEAHPLGRCPKFFKTKPADVVRARGDEVKRKAKKK